MSPVLTGEESPAIDHLSALAGASADVLQHLELLESCRFGPPVVLEAAAADLQKCLAELDRLGPRSTGQTLASLVAGCGDGPRAALAHTLAAGVRATVQQIHERSGALSLELRRLLADTQRVVSSVAGGAGTYDATGRTPAGPLRRDRGEG